MRCIKVLLVAALCAVLFSSAAFAQPWVPLNAPTGQGYPIYFVNASLGFVNISNYANSTDTLWRTTDRGTTWTPSKIPAFIRFNDFSFDSPSHGYAAVSVDHYSRYYPALGGVYETNDSGQTWNRITKTAQDYNGVYVAHHKIFAVTFSSLYWSTNNGARWDSASQLLPSQLLGNKDSLILTPFQIYNTPTHAVRYSTNLGKSWDTAYPPNQSSDRFYCVPHTCTVTRVQLFGPGISSDQQALETSQPPFATWRTGIASEEDGLDVDGTACALFLYYAGADASNAKAMRRSTDEGLTWRFLPGPPFIECDDVPKNFCVTGNGSTLYAYSYKFPTSLFPLYRWDDSLPIANPTYDLALKTPSGRVDTVYMRACDTSLLRLTYTPFSCIHTDFAGLHVAGLDSSEYTVTHTTHSACADATDTAFIKVFPRMGGLYPISLNLQTVDDEFSRYDTAISLHLRVAHSYSTLEFSGALAIHFAPQVLCNSHIVRDSFGIQPHGCEAISVDSIRFITTRGTPTDFVFSDRSQFVPGGKVQHFPIAFKPTIADTEQGLIVVSYFDGAQHYQDTIPVEGVGRTDVAELRLIADTLHILRCDSSKAASVEFRNVTCGTLWLDSVSMPSGSTPRFAIDPTAPPLPLSANPGDLVSIPVDYFPESARTLETRTDSMVLHLRFVEGGKTIQFDSVVAIPIVIDRGIAGIFAPASFAFDTITTCEKALVSIPILSNGCDTLVVSRMHLTSDTSGFALDRVISHPMATGALDSATIIFAPDRAGLRSDTLVIETNADPHVVRIPFTAPGKWGRRVLSVPTSVEDLGLLYACQSFDTTIVLRNDGCAPLLCTHGSFDRADFSSDARYPLTIRPGDSVRLNVHLTPDTAGHPRSLTAQYGVISNSDSAFTPIALTGHIVYTDKLTLALAPGSISANPSNAAAHLPLGTSGDLLTFPILLHSVEKDPTIFETVDALHFDITHDDDLLSYVSASGAGITVTSDAPKGPLVTQHFTLSPLATFDTIGSITFRINLSKSDSAALPLSGLDFDAKVAEQKDCIASLDNQSSSFQYAFACGDRVIHNMMAGLPIDIQSIEPNPAKNQLRIAFARSVQSPVQCELLDLLGRSMLKSSLSARQGSASVLDLSKVDEGSYNLRLSVNGFVVSRRIEIVK